MAKIWYIDIKGKVEGPYSVEQLRADSRITPDTLVWRQGFDGWKPLRDVEELKNLFDESPEHIEEPVKTEFKPRKSLPGDEVLEMGEGPPDWISLILLLLVFLYLIQHYLYWR